MKCKVCREETDENTEICTKCGTDNHDYTIDWRIAVDGMLF